MKKIMLALMCFLYASVASANSRTLSGTTETEQFGMAAGAAYACGADEDLKNFELIVSCIIRNKASSKMQARNEMRKYAEEKFRSYKIQKNSAPIPCDEVLRLFKGQTIFNSTVYADGSVKLPDGTLLKARP